MLWWEHSFSFILLFTEVTLISYQYQMSPIDLEIQVQLELALLENYFLENVKNSRHEFCLFSDISVNY